MAAAAAAAGAPLAGVHLAGSAATGGIVQAVSGAHHALVISNVPPAGVHGDGASGHEEQAVTGRRLAVSGLQLAFCCPRRPGAPHLPAMVLLQVAGAWCKSLQRQGASQVELRSRL